MPHTEPAQLAYHCHRAGEHRAALSASVSAGIEAARIYAFAEARAHFERAIDLWDAVHPGRDVTPLDKVELLGRAAQAARFSGDPQQAIALCRQAIAEIDVAAEPLRAAMLHERLGEYHYWDDEAAFECYEQALAIIPSDPTPERARLLAAQGHALMGLRRWKEARERCEAALRIAEQIGAGHHEASARITLGLVLEFLGEHEGEQHLRRAMQIAQAVGANEEIARAHLHLAELYRLRGEHEAALKVMVEGEQIAARMGMSASFGNFMHVNATDDLFRLGRWDEVRQRLADSERMDLGVTAAAMHYEISGHLAALRGDAATADAAFERVDALVEQGLPCECVTTAAIASTARALVDGDPLEARRRVADAVATVGDAQDPLYTPPLYALGVRAEADLAEQARALRRDTDVLAARSRAQELAADLESVLQRAGGVAPDASAYRDLTQAELSRVEGASRVELWREAAAAFHPLGEPYPAAYARLRQAEAILQSRQDRVEATELLIDAHEVALRLGAEPLRRDIEALARRAKLDLTPPAAERPAADTDPLAALGVTRRERDVLMLLCDGLSNRQIAERLFISEKTVSTHLGHIFEKLGVHSRHEAVTVCQRLVG
jgi:ATP/maltotriose-dependent transcriptional regulator MalT